MIDIRETWFKPRVKALRFEDYYGRKAYLYYDNDEFVLTKALDVSNTATYVQYSFYTDGTYRYRQGVRDGKFVIDRYISNGGDLDLFNAGGGTAGVDYELVSSVA